MSIFVNNVTDGCLARNYLPYPPRLWQRSSTPCYLFLENMQPDTLVTIPYINKTIPASQLGAVTKMFSKGNVLQYPCNRSLDTKKTTFSKISRGAWTSRKKSWSSQTTSFTNPNVNQLYRSNSSINSNNANGQTFFADCQIPKKTTVSFPYPSQSGGQTNYPNIPESKDANTTSYAYPTTTVPPKLNESIIEGGNLVSCTNENICTGLIKSALKDIACYPTSSSDVPGPIINLCYPNNIPVTIPRQIRTYTNNATKWPTNGITNIPAYNTNVPIKKAFDIQAQVLL